ncbi:MAG: hypothetical protein MI806_08025 [Minwuiales bacterium]|nr:hypothetical protein [Minwuiales bacterium]
MALTEGHWKAFQLAADFVGRGVGPALIAAAIAWVGIEANSQLNKTNLVLQERAEETKRINLSLDVMSRQKELDINVGMRLLENLLQGFIQPSNGNNDPALLETRLLLAELVALNLWDVPVNLRPLFDYLGHQSGLAPEKKARIQSITKAVARKQAFRLASGGSGWDSGEIEVEGGKPMPIPNLAFGTAELTVKIGAISDDQIEVTLVSGTEGQDVFGPFAVSYYDMPLIDNAKLDLFRVALLLLDTDQERNRAKVRLIVFDSELAVDRIDISQESRLLRLQ